MNIASTRLDVQTLTVTSTDWGKNTDVNNEDSKLKQCSLSSQTSNPLLTSDRDILNSPDEEGLSSRLQSFNEATLPKGKYVYDSGISESFCSSQGSITEGYNNSQLTSVSNTKTPTSMISQPGTYSLALDSSCGLPSSDTGDHSFVTSEVTTLDTTVVVPITGSCIGNITHAPVTSRASTPLYSSQSFTHTNIKGEGENRILLSKSHVLYDKSVRQYEKPKDHAPREKSPGIADSNVCSICLCHPKDASLVHGKSGHQVCCYRCGLTLKRSGKSCPVCRRPIQKVIRNYPA